MRRQRAFSRLVPILLFGSVASSCGLLTFDCGGPYSREALASTTVFDLADTLSIDPYASTYEEQSVKGAYTHSLMLGIQATDAAHYDTIPTALRPHVTGLRLVLPSGTVLYHAVFANTTSHQNGPPVLGFDFTKDLDQSLFDTIRSHLLANDLSAVIESDSTIEFPPAKLAVQRSHGWIKSSGCQ
jgi:hypothetical protein